MERKIKVITDNGCDLPQELIDSYSIHMIKFGMTLEGVEYVGETNNEITLDFFYEKLQKGVFPTTNQINPYVARSHIEPFVKEGYDILYVSFSSGLSSSYNSVTLACETLKEEYPDRKLYVVDSLCASLGQGLLLDYVMRYIPNASTFEEVVEYTENLKLRIHHDFTVGDLFHLKKGGRLSASSAIVGTILSIKPILHVDEKGKLVSIGKVRGRKASIRRVFEMFKEGNQIDDEDPIYICHSNCYEEALELEKMVKEEKPNNRTYINDIGPIIATHSGAGTIAIFYKGKARN